MNNTKKSLKYLKKIPFRGNVYIYGTGTCSAIAEQMISSYRKDINILGYIDSYKSGILNGREVMHVDSFDKRRQEFDTVLISSAFSEEIREILRSKGIGNYTIFNGSIDNKTKYIIFRLGRIFKESIKVFFILIFLFAIWIAQFMLFLPAILIAFFLFRNINNRKDQDTLCLKDNINIKRINNFAYNRIDISKIYDCNTRNVHYRWDIFENALKLFKDRFKNEETISALDFGAGSLRDTYELAKLGFKVVAVDINGQSLETFKESYNWDSVSFVPEIITGSLDMLKQGQKFHLIIAFDILEHLYNLDEFLEELYNKIFPKGMLFITVPNKRSFFEMYYRHQHKKLPLNDSGNAHVQFNTPHKWQKIFIKKGFKILDHDMALGFFVNDCWCGFYSILTRKFIDPYIVRYIKKNYRRCSFEKIFYPSYLMKKMNLIDRATKSLLKHRWGWSLFVLTPDL